MVTAWPMKRERESRHRRVVALLIPALLATLGVPAMAAVVSLPGALSLTPGQVVVAPLTIDTMSGIIAMDFDVAYDPAVLEVTAVSKTTLTQSFTLTYNVECVGQPPDPCQPTGLIYVSLFATVPVTGGGPAFTITFEGQRAGCSVLGIARALLNEGDIPSVRVEGNAFVCGMTDGDGDGLTECGGDCSDRFAFVHPGATELCNGADDDCDGSFDEGGVCVCGSAPRPRSEEFWRTICLGTEIEGTIAPGYADTVNDFLTFSGVAGREDICAVQLPAMHGDPCVPAEAAFMTLALNLASGRLCPAQTITATSTPATTVGNAASAVDALLAATSRTAEDCLEAWGIAAEINGGAAIPDFLSEEIVLSAARDPSGNVVLAWADPDAYAAGRPVSFRVYRAPAGAPPTWTLIAETACHERYVDFRTPGASTPLVFYRVAGWPP